MTDDNVGAKHREYMERALIKARSRQTFDFPLAQDEAPRSDRLSEGPARPALIGIPATAALSSTYQYLEFAKSFRDTRDLFAIAVPGFVTGERLPASAQAAVEVESNVVRRCTNDTPAVLIGIGSGGALAYGIASHLESMGLPVAAVVLMDTYPFRSATYDENHMYAVYGKMFEDSKLRRYLTDTRVTAMAWYARLFMDWELPEISAPTLLVQPSDPMPDMSRDGEWRSHWPHPHHTIEVPGNHWSMMIEDAGSTARAVETWLHVLPTTAGQSAGVSTGAQPESHK